MIAAVYARKSTDDSDRNEEARSTVRQVERAMEYARAKGWTVDQRLIFVDDAVSGAEWKHRPAFNALTASLEPRPPFNVLIVSELSRIGRDTVRTPAAVLQLEEAGIEIWSYLSDARISLADEMGEAMTILNSLASSWERRRAKQRVYDALRRRVEAGAVHGGKVYGYRNERRGGYVYRVIQEDEARIVHHIFELSAEGYGVDRIAKALNAEGVKPPRSHGGWAPSAIRALLFNPIYHGEIIWNKTQKTMRRGTKGQRRRDESEWMRLESPELAIIPPDLAAAVKARLRAGAARFTRRTGPVTGGDTLSLAYPSSYLLTNFARCAECGGRIGTVTRTHGNPRRRWIVRFYGCTTHSNRGSQICRNATLLRHEILDGAFLDAIRASIDDDLLQDAVARAVSLRQERQSAAPGRRLALERELQAVDQKVDRLVNAIAMGGPLEELLERLGTERARRTSLLVEQKALNGQEADQTEARLVARLTTHAAELRSLLGTHVPQTRKLLATMLAGPVVMFPVAENGRRGYRFEGRLRLGGVLSGETRETLVAPTGFEPVSQP